MENWNETGETIHARVRVRACSFVDHEQMRIATFSMSSKCVVLLLVIRVSFSVKDREIKTIGYLLYHAE